MILTCPHCTTRYQTDAAQFPAQGRKVRCAKCGNVWHQDPPSVEQGPGAGLAEPEVGYPGFQSEQAATVYPPPLPSLGEEAHQHGSYMPPAPAVPHPSVGPERTGERAAIVAAWVGLAVIVIVAAWSTIRFREAIADAWPQSASFYAAIGMKVNVRGIDITDVVPHRTMEGGQAVLTISGELVNITSRAVPVPPISIKLTDEDQHELDHWSFSASVATLKPGQKIGFTTRRTNPPEEARHLDVSFAGGGG